MKKFKTTFMVALMLMSTFVSVQPLYAETRTHEDCNLIAKERSEILDIEQEAEKDKQERYLGEFELTFYTNSISDCGKTDGITASGKVAKSKHTIATDKRFPFGTVLEIEGWGTYVVEDRGGAVRGNIIDVYVDSTAEAIKLGRVKNVKVYYAKPKEGGDKFEK